MSTPIFDPEDPKLTAYALGELTDPVERAEVEALLQHNPEAELAMKEIRDLTGALIAEYDQERRVTEGVDTPERLPSNVINLALPSRSGPAWRRPLLAAAAVLLLVGALARLLLPVVNSVKVSAHKRVASAAPASPSKEDVMALLPSTTHPGLAQAKPGTASAQPKEGSSNAATLLPSEASQNVGELRQKIAQVDEPAQWEAKMVNRQRLPVFNSVPYIVKNRQTTNSLADPLDPAASGATDNNLLKSDALASGPATLAIKDGRNVAGPALSPTIVTAKKAEGTTYTLGKNGDGHDATDDARAKEAKQQSSSELALAQAQVARASHRETARDEIADDRYAQKSLPSGSVGLPSGATPRGTAAAPTTAEMMAKAKFFITAGSGPEITQYNTPRVSMFPLSPGSGYSTAAYEHLEENPFLGAKENPLSTFSIDVDTASYANVRRFIEGGSLPPPDAVRVEELLNYFPYNDAPPAADSGQPFAVHLEAAACPWMPEHRLVRIGIKGKEIAQEKCPASNLVFLIDVSGSMQPPERLPLIKRAMSMMVEHLTDQDHVAIVTYAGESGLALPTTSGEHKDAILTALDKLRAGGSTNGAAGITLAYQVAKAGFITGGTNRVILATDGDFNVGVTSQGDLVRLIQDEARSGVFLSALGVGTDNYKDATMQKLADKGNGNYHYVDRIEEARKVLVDQMSGTLVTIAKDVKIQVEFNPAVVSAYRLIGYEKRMLRKEDFNDDRVDAGEIGAGHSVTALYEVVPVGQTMPEESPAVDALKYAAKAVAAATSEPAKAETVASGSAEMLTVKMRYKTPYGDKSERSEEVPLTDAGQPGDFTKASADFKFAAAVAEFGLALRDSPYKGTATLGSAVEMAQEGKGADAKGYRAGFIDLARRAQEIKGGK